MWVGYDLIIPVMEYASLEILVTTLELIPASKRLLSSDTPQGNTELLRAWAVPSKCIPNQVMINQYGLVYHAFKMKWTYHETWAQ